jgi:3-oxoadipate enol-lactonase
VSELEGPAGRLHFVVTGDDEPVTVFAPGLAQSIADTRPFGSAVQGTRVFVDLRGHGGSAAPTADEEWTYRALADDVACVADAHGATRALGVSLGAGAIIALLTMRPRRFERVVLALPGPLTSPRHDAELVVTDELAEAIEHGPGGDPSRIASALVAMQPAAVRRRADVKLWARRHATELGGRSGTARAIRTLPRETVLRSLDALADVTADVLVLAQRDDDVHPLAAAEQLASALPKSTLEVSDVPWMWGARSALRDTVSGFLNA